MYEHSYLYTPVHSPDDESRNVPPPQVSAVHTLGDAPRRVSEPLQVKQCTGLAGLEQVAQESSHPVWSRLVNVKSLMTTRSLNAYKMVEYC